MADFKYITEQKKDMTTQAGTDLEMIYFERPETVRAKVPCMRVNDCQSQGTAKSQSHRSDTSSQLTGSQMGEESQQGALSVHNSKEPIQQAMKTKSTGIIRLIPLTVIALESVNVHLQR